MIEISETDHRFTLKQGCVCATELIPTGDYLEIIGVYVDVANISNICTSYAAGLKIANEPETSFQHAIIPMGYGALVRPAGTPEQQNVALTYIPETYVRRNPACGNVVYLATRDIQPGEELLSGQQKNDAISEPTDLHRWKQLLSQNFYGLASLLDPKVVVPQ